MTERYDSEPERFSLPAGMGYEWRVTSALITESVVALGDMRTFMTKVTLPYSAHLTEDETHVFMDHLHHAMIDKLIEMGKL